MDWFDRMMRDECTRKLPSSRRKNRVDSVESLVKPGSRSKTDFYSGAGMIQGILNQGILGDR